MNETEQGAHAPEVAVAKERVRMALEALDDGTGSIEALMSALARWELMLHVPSRQTWLRLANKLKRA